MLFLLLTRWHYWSKSNGQCNPARCGLLRGKFWQYRYRSLSMVGEKTGMFTVHLHNIWYISGLIKNLNLIQFFSDDKTVFTDTGTVLSVTLDFIYFITTCSSKPNIGRKNKMNIAITDGKQSMCLSNHWLMLDWWYGKELWWHTLYGALKYIVVSKFKKLNCYKNKLHYQIQK